MPRELHIKGHIVASVNLVASDGEPFCHLLLDDSSAGADLVASLQAASIISDTDDATRSLDGAPAKYKRASGDPLHQFAGADVRRTPPVEEPQP